MENWEVPEAIRWTDLQRAIIDHAKELTVLCEECSKFNSNSKNPKNEVDANANERSDEEPDNNNNNNNVSQKSKPLRRDPNYLIIEGFLLFQPQLLPFFDK